MKHMNTELIEVYQKMYDSMAHENELIKNSGFTIESFLKGFEEFSLITSCVDQNLVFHKKNLYEGDYPESEKSIPIYFTMYGVTDAFPLWRKFLAVRSFLKWATLSKNMAIVSDKDISEATKVYNKLSDFENIYEMYEEVNSVIDKFNKELLYIQKKMDIYDNYTISLEN